MAAEAHSIPIDELLAHDAWLRRMVADLVEPDLVDDVVQETFLAAWLRGKQAELRNLPGFLRRVGRNLAIRHRRTEVRRRQREQQNAPNEQLPSTTAMLERLQAHRQLTEAVAQLDEPYRTTVLLRYFEDLTPKQIAERQGVAASTVRTRLERGLGQLHGRLGGKDLRALAALFLWPGAEALATTTTTATAGIAPGVVTTMFSGAVFMTLHSKAVLLGSVGALLLGVGIWQAGVFASDDKPGEVPIGRPLVADYKDDAAQTGPGKVAERVPISKSAKTEPVPVDGPLRGRVVDTSGQPLRDIPFTLFGYAETTVTADAFLRSKPRTDGVVLAKGKTDQRGRFRLAPSILKKGIQALQAALGGDYVQIRSHVPGPGSWQNEEAIVVAARKMAIEGRVVDRAGLPVMGVMLIPRVDGLRGFSEPLDHTEAHSLEMATSDQNGEFRIKTVPNTAELELHVAAPKGYYSQVVSDLREGRRVRVLLRKKGRSRSMLLTGRVIDRGQRLIAGVTVGIGGRTTRTDDNGRFRLRVRTLPDNAKLFVGRKGHQTRLYADTLGKLREEGRLEGVVLTLGDPALALRGRVVDQNGEPVVKLPIVLENATYLEFVTSAEDYARGEAGKIDGVLSANGSPAKTDATTDADGRFVVRGLSARPYVLRAWIPKSLVNVTTKPLQPGTTEHQITLRMDAVHETVSGVVRSRNGQVLVGTNVYVQFKTFDNGSMTMWAVGSGTKTDEKGRFVLKNVPKSGVRVSVWSKDIVDFAHALQESDNVANLVLTPFRRCHFRVALTEKVGANSLRVLDAAGKDLKLYRTQGGMSMTGEKWTVKSGKAPTLAVSEAATTIVFSAGDKELKRIPVRLVAGQVTVVR